MAAAVGSGVGHRNHSEEKGSDYQNCAADPAIHSYYQNCIYLTNFASKQDFRHGSADKIASSLPESLPESRQDTHGEGFSTTKQPTTSISLTQPEAISSIPENQHQTLPTKRSHDKKQTKRPSSAQLRFNRAQKTSKNKMGSGSSVAKESEATTKSRYKKKQTNDSSSDNGGFETGTPKPALGVKEKLRYSLDKLSLKSPFRWSSSDKISNNVKSSKSKSKNNRRFSDSGAAFTNAETLERKQSDKEQSRNKNVQGVSRMVRAYPAIRCGSTDTEIMFDDHGFDSGQNHTYVNLSDDTKPLKLQTSSTSENHGFNSSHGRAQNDYYQARSLNHYQEMSTLPSLQAWKNNDTATRAKGTWKMLKTTRSKQIPMKPHASEPNFHPEYSDFLHPNEVQLPEFAPEMAEVPSMEPPKLAPVSGMLLLNKDAEKTILRPTVFRPTPILNHNSPLAIHVNNESPWQIADNVETLPEREAPLRRDENDCTSSASNRSDSGRHSTTSIPVGVTNGGSFSCSGSEGYESARIPSSTNHSTVHDHECSVTDSLPVFSPRKLSDETLLTSLEARMRERQGQVDLLRKDIEDNQKALRDMVQEEPSDVEKARNSNTLRTREKTSNQIKLQRRASVHEHQMNEQHYRRLHQEQKQLHDANAELEERIKTMTEAIDAHTRKEDQVTEMQARLEENEMEAQQQRGEISLLKRQIKEKQTELTQRINENLALKSQNRDLTNQLALRESENESLHIQLGEEKIKFAELEQHLTVTNLQQAPPKSDSSVLSSSRSTNEFGRYRNTQSAYVTDFSTTPSTYDDQTTRISFEPKTSAVAVGSPFYPGEREELYRQLQAVEHRMALQEEAFEREQQQWAEDKRKVIKYQKLLQENYVQMYKRSHALEREVKQLKSQLQMAGLSSSTNCDLYVGNSVPEPDEQHRLSFPMEI